jgi:hypothetical protein
LNKFTTKKKKSMNMYIRMRYPPRMILRFCASDSIFWLPEIKDDNPTGNKF